jgi:hypothetical protein
MIRPHLATLILLLSAPLGAQAAPTAVFTFEAKPATQDWVLLLEGGGATAAR